MPPSLVNQMLDPLIVILFVEKYTFIDFNVWNGKIFPSRGTQKPSVQGKEPIPKMTIKAWEILIYSYLKSCDQALIGQKKPHQDLSCRQE